MEFRKLLQIFEATPTPAQGVTGQKLAQTSGGQFMNRADRTNQAKVDAALGSGFKAGSAAANLALAKKFSQPANPNQAAVDASNKVKADQTAAVAAANTDTSTNDPYNPATDPSLQAGYKEIASPVDNTADASAGANNSNGAAAALANMGRNANQNAAPANDAGQGAKPATSAQGSAAGFAPAAQTANSSSASAPAANADNNTQVAAAPSPFMAAPVKDVPNPPAGSAAKPAEKVPDNVAPVVKTGTGGTLTDRSGNPVKSRSADEIANTGTFGIPKQNTNPATASYASIGDFASAIGNKFKSAFGGNQPAAPNDAGQGAKPATSAQGSAAGFAPAAQTGAPVIPGVNASATTPPPPPAAKPPVVAMEEELEEELAEMLRLSGLAPLNEKAVSKQQQKFMGMVHAMQKGEKVKGASKELKKTAKSMNKKDAHDFAATKHKGLPARVDESVMLDEAGSVMDHIKNRFKHEVRNFMSTGFMDDDLYHALHDYYRDKGEMPYSVIKDDPHGWVEERFYMDMGSGMSEGIAATHELTELARLAGLTEGGNNPYKGVPSEKGTPMGAGAKPSISTPPAAGRGAKPSMPGPMAPSQGIKSQEPVKPVNPKDSGDDWNPPQEKKSPFDRSSDELTECGDMSMGQEDSMNVSTNMSSDGNKSINISAQGSKADALLQMLKMAGLRPHDDHSVGMSEPEVIMIGSDHEEMIDEGSSQRLIKKLGDAAAGAKIYKDMDWNEFIVKFYKDGVALPEETWHHTDDLEDAMGTAQNEIARMSMSGEEMMEDAGGVQVHDLSGMSGREIYDETQTNDDIHDGDVLLTTSGVGIMVEAWPVLVAGDIDGFHKLKDTSWEEFEGGKYLDSYNKAMEASGQGLEEEYANTPNKEYHTVGSILRQGNDLNREKQQWNPDRARDNPMAFDLEESLAEMLESIKVKEEESTWLQRQPSKSQAEIAADWDRRMKTDPGEIEAEKPYRDAKTGKMITPPRGATNPPADSQYPPGDKRNMMPPGRK